MLRNAKDKLERVTVLEALSKLSQDEGAVIFSLRHVSVTVLLNIAYSLKHKKPQKNSEVVILVV